MLINNCIMGLYSMYGSGMCDLLMSRDQILGLEFEYSRLYIKYILYSITYIHYIYVYILIMESNLTTNYIKIQNKILSLKSSSDKLEKDEILQLYNSLSSIFKEVSSSNTFSLNEDFAEIQTENIKYMQIPYYQSVLIQSIDTTNTYERQKNLNISIQLYDEYYKLLKSYSFISKEENDIYKSLLESIYESQQGDKEKEKEKTGKKGDLLKMTNEREEKIRIYKEKKELNDKIKYLQSKNLEDSREYYTALITLSWKEMIDNMKHIRNEIESLSYINKIKNEGKYEDFLSEGIEKNKNKKFEFMKITPETMKSINNNSSMTDSQAKLLNGIKFGCVDGCSNLDSIVDKRINYKNEIFRNPNQPTMTLDEFADKQIVLMEQQKVNEEESKKRQKDEDELSDHYEDVDDRRKKEKRMWDDWKDLHEKGSGNKMG